MADTQVVAAEAGSRLPPFEVSPAHIEALECVPVPIVLLDAEVRIHIANRAFRALAGLETSELEGCSLADLARALWGVDSIGEKLVGIAQGLDTVAFELENAPGAVGSRAYSVTAKPLAGKPGMYVVTFEDITQRRKAERLIALHNQELQNQVKTGAHTLERTREELRELAAHLFTVQEEERQRVARDLHDDVGQRLSLLQILISEIDCTIWSRQDAARFATIKSLLQDLNEDVRQISHRLHPSILKDLGLSTALRSLVEEFGRREEIPAVYLAHDPPGKVSAAAETALYRIAQEALRNIAKHAGKTHTEVHLDGRADGVYLRVVEFGAGFEKDTLQGSPTLGLISMQERAHLAGGVFRIDSSPGCGTTIEVQVPLEI